MTQTPAGWYPANDGQERYWDGNAWTDQVRPIAGASPPAYTMNAQPPKKKHTLRNILLVFMLLAILAVGGCLALFAGAANEVDKAIKEEEANDKPRDVVAGTAFEHDGYEVDAGWKVGRDEFGGYANITGLRITNQENDEFTGEGGRTALLTFRFYRGSENLAEVICTGKELQEGESSSMDCSSTDKFPKGYKKIRVADSF